MAPVNAVSFVEVAMSDESPWLQETFCGHAVQGVMVQDEVLLKVFSGPESLAIATKFCESLASSKECAKVVRQVTETLNEASSEYMGLRILRIENGTPVENVCWYESKFRKKSKGEE